MPCLSALKREFDFPEGVLGPVLICALRLMASARFDEVAAVSLMVGGPIGGMWIGEVSSSKWRVVQSRTIARVCHLLLSLLL
jgi:hypothetical protein